ncbi:hypothetical protein ACWF82_11900 [Nocardia sp. NPDC055053]
MRTRLRAERALIAGTAAAWLVACGVSTPDSPSSVPGSHLACAESRSADAMFTSEPGEGGFTIQAPRLPGWTQQHMEGSSAGFVLHRFDPPTEESDMGTATITLTAFNPVDTADAALTNLRTLRASGIEFSYESSKLMFPIQIRSQLRAADTTRYAAEVRTIFDGVRIVP